MQFVTNRRTCGPVQDSLLGMVASTLRLVTNRR